VPWTHSRRRADVADTGAPETISLEASLRSFQDVLTLFVIFRPIDLPHCSSSTRIEHSL
jgi:hypothetical protein